MATPTSSDPQRQALFDAVDAELRARNASEEERELAYAMARALDLSNLDDAAEAVGVVKH